MFVLRMIPFLEGVRGVTQFEDGGRTEVVDEAPHHLLEPRLAGFKY